MNKQRLREAAKDLSKNTMELIQEILIRHDMALLEECNEMSKKPTSKPLTNQEITSLMINHDFDSTYRDRIHSLIRAVELVHGIGGEG